ncbi:MAG: hypothetical protein ACE5J3_09920 [Methanosarcinales archaeon]
MSKGMNNNNNEEKEDTKLSKKQLIGIIGLLILLAIAVSFTTTTALFSGSHATYLNKTDQTEFCQKCHPNKVSTIMVSAHKNASCLCHGYNPSATPEYNINLAHNLTKQIYCTNCHSNYDSEGNITIHTNPYVSGLNQTAHYLTNNTSILYAHSKQFFNQE